MDASTALTKSITVQNFSGKPTQIALSVAETQEDISSGRVLVTRHTGVQLLSSQWERLLDLPVKRMRFLRLDAAGENAEVQYLHRFNLPWRYLDFAISLPEETYADEDDNQLPNHLSEAVWWLNDVLFRAGIDYIRQFAEDPDHDVYLEHEHLERCVQYGIAVPPVNTPSLHRPWIPEKDTKAMAISTQYVRAAKPARVIDFMGGFAMNYCLKVALQRNSPYCPIEELEGKDLFPGANDHATIGLMGVQYEDSAGNLFSWPRDLPAANPSKITFVCHVWHNDGVDIIRVPGSFAATVSRNNDDMDDTCLALSVMDSTPEDVTHIARALELVGAAPAVATQTASVAVHGADAALTDSLRRKLQALYNSNNLGGTLDDVTIKDGVATFTISGTEHHIDVATTNDAP